MTNQECGCCHAHGQQRADLVHDETARQITVCLRCLRSAMQMKAAAEDKRGRARLFEFADRFAWHVWRSGHVLYLLPSIAPFDPRAPAAVVSSVAGASESSNGAIANVSHLSLRPFKPGMRFSKP